MVRRFWQLFYSVIVIPLLWLLLRAASLSSAKVRRGIRGRATLFAMLEARMATIPRGSRVWFHSSSMGEFEQAKPIIAELKRRRPDVIVITTFFSPSGYEHSRKYALADVISYLPFDTRRAASRFLDIVAPDVAVMVRYDVWPNHIWELSRRRIPVLIANATMRRQSPRRTPPAGNFHHHVYNCIDEILTVSDADGAAFGMFHLDHPVINAIGDTRFDQVSARSAEARRRHLLTARITENRKVIVAGSTWPEDEAVLLPAFLALHSSNPEVLLILVPHEPTLEHLEDLEAELDDTVTHIRFSAMNEYRDERVIIVDSIGVLLPLYAHASVAYVGGSFRQGVHNTLEAAVYGIPVLFGPKHRNSQEPLHLVDHGGAFVVSDAPALERTLRNLLGDEKARSRAGERAAAFVRAHTGATDRFLSHLEPYLTD